MRVPSKFPLPAGRGVLEFEICDLVFPAIPLRARGVGQLVDRQAGGLEAESSSLSTPTTFAELRMASQIRMALFPFAKGRNSCFNACFSP